VKDAWARHYSQTNFCEGKSQETRSAKALAALQRAQSRKVLGYLILAAVTSMMVLYALIIFFCLKHPEW